MKFAIRLAMLGTLLFVNACAAQTAPKQKLDAAQPKADPDAARGCNGCRWESFLGKPIRVQRIECTYAGKPEHCHLTTEKSEPRREVTVTFDSKTGAFNWQLETPGKPEDRMDCPNLAPDMNNKRLIEGTCIIYDSDHGPAVHFFRATVVPKESNPREPAITAEFRHTPFCTGPEPVHDGHIHLGGD